LATKNCQSGHFIARKLTTQSYTKQITPNTLIRIIRNITFFYYQGFKSMTVGKKLWTIIIIKLVIIFLVLKLFFFPDLLNTNFKTDKERSNHVIEQLTK
jgi:hypothetical protein